MMEIGAVIERRRPVYMPGLSEQELELRKASAGRVQTSRGRRVAISGSRGKLWTPATFAMVTAHIPIHLKQRVGPGDTVLVGDENTGVDAIVRQFCENAGLDYEVYEADWETHGRAAGPIRNKAMLGSGVDLLIAWWNGESRGTANAINTAQAHDIPTEVFTVTHTRRGM